MFDAIRLIAPVRSIWSRRVFNVAAHQHWAVLKFCLFCWLKRQMGKQLIQLSCMRFAVTGKHMFLKCWRQYCQMSKNNNCSYFNLDKGATFLLKIIYKLSLNRWLIICLLIAINFSIFVCLKIIHSLLHFFQFLYLFILYYGKILEFNCKSVIASHIRPLSVIKYRQGY